MQPTAFLDLDGNLKYNKRKIKQLPLFLSKLTPNLAIPLACEHVFFNYHFLTGMFSYYNFSELISVFFSFLSLIRGHRFKRLNELNILFYSFLDSGVKMTHTPSAGVSYILERSLKFYEKLEYFTKLIDEYDLESNKNSSLKIAYQYLDFPCNNLLFQWEKHEKPILHTIISIESSEILLFTLSNKMSCLNFNGMIDLGEIEISKQESKDYSIFLVFTFGQNKMKAIDALKNINGGFIIGSRNQLEMISFDLATKAKKDFPQELKIKQVYFISLNHIIILYEQRNFIDIFNFNLMQNFSRFYFNQNIKQIICNTHLNVSNEMSKLMEKDIYIVVLLESNEIEVLLVESNCLPMLNDKYLNLICLKNIFKLPSPGGNLLFESMQFSLEKRIHSSQII